MEGFDKFLTTLEDIAIVALLAGGAYVAYRIYESVSSTGKGIMSAFENFGDNLKDNFGQFTSDPGGKTLNFGEKYVNGQITDIRSVTSDFSFGHAFKFWGTHFTPIAPFYFLGRAAGLIKEDDDGSLSEDQSARAKAKDQAEIERQKKQKYLRWAAYAVGGILIVFLVYEIIS